MSDRFDIGSRIPQGGNPPDDREGLLRDLRDFAGKNKGAALVGDIVDGKIMLFAAADTAAALDGVAKPANAWERQQLAAIALYEAVAAAHGTEAADKMMDSLRGHLLEEGTVVTADLLNDATGLAERAKRGEELLPYSPGGPPAYAPPPVPQLVPQPPSALTFLTDEQKRALAQAAEAGSKAGKDDAACGPKPVSFSGVRPRSQVFGNAEEFKALPTGSPQPVPEDDDDDDVMDAIRKDLKTTADGGGLEEWGPQDKEHVEALLDEVADDAEDAIEDRKAQRAKRKPENSSGDPLQSAAAAVKAAKDLQTQQADYAQTVRDRNKAERVRRLASKKTARLAANPQRRRQLNAAHGGRVLGRMGKKLDLWVAQARGHKPPLTGRQKDAIRAAVLQAFEAHPGRTTDLKGDKLKAFILQALRDHFTVAENDSGPVDEAQFD